MTRHMQGATLIETLIGLVLGVIVVGSSLSMLYGVVRTNVETARITRMEHEMRSALGLIITDIRRAGYWGSAATDVNSNANNNPFLQAATKLQVSGSNNCLIFTYDANNDGKLAAMAATPTDERFGFRLSNNTIQSRPSSLATFDCADAPDLWDDVTNTSIVNVTSLNFNMNSQVVDVDGTGPGTATVTVNSIDVTMIGQLASDPSVIRTLSETIRLRNDLYSP